MVDSGSGLLAIQPEEAAQLSALAPSVRVEVLPVGVDVSRFSVPHAGEPPVVGRQQLRKAHDRVERADDLAGHLFA